MAFLTPEMVEGNCGKDNVKREERQPSANPLLLATLKVGFTWIILNALRVEFSVHLRRTAAPRGWVIKLMAITTDDNVGRKRGMGSPYARTRLHCVTERITEMMVTAFQLE